MTITGLCSVINTSQFGRRMTDNPYRPDLDYSRLSNYIIYPIFSTQILNGLQNHEKKNHTSSLQTAGLYYALSAISFL